MSQDPDADRREGGGAERADLGSLVLAVLG
jgi:hypothetical protein